MVKKSFERATCKTSDEIRKQTRHKNEYDDIDDNHPTSNTHRAGHILPTANPIIPGKKLMRRGNFIHYRGAIRN
jgi:hypothetical protein